MVEPLVLDWVEWDIFGLRKAVSSGSYILVESLTATVPDCKKNTTGKLLGAVLIKSFLSRADDERRPSRSAKPSWYCRMMRRSAAERIRQENHMHLHRRDAVVVTC